MKKRIGGKIKCVVCSLPVESETMDITCGNACANFLNGTHGIAVCPDCGSTDVEATYYCERMCRSCDGLFFVPSENEQREKQCERCPESRSQNGTCNADTSKCQLHLLDLLRVKLLDGGK